MVTCCCKHKCWLLETCGHCDEVIPLFTSPFILSKCSKCQQGLELCTVASISDEVELQVAMHVHDDIVFLLTPHLWEENSGSIIRRVGRRFAYMRQMKRLTAVEVASKIGVTLTVVEGIERGDFQGRGATLQSYFKYAYYLCISLKDVFIDVVDASDGSAVTSLPLCPACQQSYYVIRAGYNRSSSQRYQCRYCHHGFTTLPKARKVNRL